MEMLQSIEKIKLVGLDFEFRIFGDKENPLFLANEVAKAIEHTKMSMMLEIVGGSKVVNSAYLIDSVGRKQEMKLLTEKQVYRILMRSDKPIAMSVQDGIFDFLKAWRKGEVKVIDIKTKLLADLFSEDKMTVVHAHKTLVEMAVAPIRQELVETKADLDTAVDQIAKLIRLGVKTTFDVNSASKLLGYVNLGERNLFKLMRDEKWVTLNNTPSQQLVNEGKMVAILKHNKYTDQMYIQTRLTVRGLFWLGNKLTKLGHSTTVTEEMLIKQVDEIIG